jgi:hypothetical protein
MHRIINGLNRTRLRSHFLHKNQQQIMQQPMCRLSAPLIPDSYFFSTNTPCPFRALRISKKTPYSTAKKSFLKIAMNNHPDVLNQRLDKDDPDYETKMKKAVDLFMKSRTAFESLVEGDDGVCILRIEVEAQDELMNDQQFDAWFENETGFRNPQFDLDPKTMREVAAATASMGGGLDRDGGMWTLANMVSNSVKEGKKAGSTLRLEAGAIQDKVPVEELEGKLRRRRRPGRSQMRR